MCASIDEVPHGADQGREISLYLQRLENLIEEKKQPDLYPKILLPFLFGCFYVKQARAWPSTIQTLAAFARTYHKLFWTEILPRIQKESSEETGLVDGEDDDQQNASTLNLAPSIDAALARLASASDLLQVRMRDALAAPLASNLATLQGTVQTQLWKVLAAVPTVAEQHAADLVPLFIHFLTEK